MHFSLNLGGIPRIVQAGLSLHGHLRKERFFMHDVWGLHVYFYSGKLRLEGEEFLISYGTVSITPPNVPLEWEFPDHAPHYYVHFAPSEAVRQEETQRTGGSEFRDFPVMNGPFERFDEIVRDMEIIGNKYKTDKVQSQVCLWNLLWRLSEGNSVENPVPAAKALPSSVQIAASYITQNYSSPIVIKDLAGRAGVSHNYLITLFKANFGCTIEAYIRSTRCERAEFLLRNSSLSIKSIAQAVGIPDLNHFNKVMRKELGCAPSKLRGISAKKPNSDTQRKPYSQRQEFGVIGKQ